MNCSPFLVQRECEFFRAPALGPRREDKVKRTQRVVFAGTAVASILAIAALLIKRHREDDAHHEALGHCPVCDVRLSALGKYCSACGSRV